MDSNKVDMNGMLQARLVLVVCVAVSSSSALATYEAIGYFWHITDFHYDPYFSSREDQRKDCWRADGEGGARNYRKPSGLYRDYNCDSSWELIESAARMMASRQADNVDFILWTGDALSHNIEDSEESVQLASIRNLTDLLGKTFSSQFIFPALGHDDPTSKKRLGELWRRWLPSDSIKTFESGGYYIIERKTLRLQIIVLNTNLMTRNDDDQDARNQLEWLKKVLQKCEAHSETVYIVGHIPPGADERQRGIPERAYTQHHNRIYLDIVRNFSKTIVGQFFGHLHSDTFRIIYSKEGVPLSWILLAPSLTPKRKSSGHNNPGLRLYKYDKNTGRVLDYTQYYLDLPKANKKESSWQMEYNFTSYYRIAQITPSDLHGIAEKFIVNMNYESQTFSRYLRANSVRASGNGSQLPLSAFYPCDDFSCAHGHYCTITRLDYGELDECLATAPSALASIGEAAVRASTTWLLVAVACFGSFAAVL